ncbi:E3 ubiquitin-protein ligase TRIM71-like [Oopsacas minuta]|uniref:E3 ubiquitin-protein ligase TRIM71-like n=1 Tax=Oopsacas minuta TaxID=111878 RepID=A0AAV7K042_9METZ|nr:E3 ubiquitin-protein ligase TRIM71-like [Oopsacas minuta]
MATAIDHFYTQLESVRANIREQIESAIDSLIEKQTKLINRLETEYLSQLTEYKVTDNTNQSNEISIRGVNKDGRTELTTIRFQLNQDVYDNLQNIGQFVTNTTVLSDYALREPVIPDYQTKTNPVISCFKKNETNSPVLGEFKSPWGLAIEPNSGNIYISDRSHYCVQVFNPDTKFLYKFSQEMGGPVGICFSHNRVLVCQWGKNYITAHSLTGEVLKKVGKKGVGKLEFNSPWGIAASCGDLFVCERENDRVQVLTENLGFKSFLGEGELKDPRDVKVTSNEVYVLDAHNPCMHIYNLTDYQLIRSIISLKSQISNPYFFDLDRENNIIISDAANQCIYIFSNTGVLIHRIGELLEVLKDIMAVVIDKNGRICCVSGCSQGVFNIF